VGRMADSPLAQELRGKRGEAQRRRWAERVAAEEMEVDMVFADPATSAKALYLTVLQCTVQYCTVLDSTTVVYRVIVEDCGDCAILYCAIPHTLFCVPCGGRYLLPSWSASGPHSGCSLVRLWLSVWSTPAGGCRRGTWRCCSA